MPNALPLRLTLSVMTMLVVAACGEPDATNQNVSTTTTQFAPPDSTVTLDSDSIGGVVTSTNGPEAGVWVIAETRDLPTLYSKTVVTDEQGRYVIPDLPNASYEIWVRGYGLVDSARITAAPAQS